MNVKNGGADPVRSNAATKTTSSHEEAGQHENTAPGERDAPITAGDDVALNVKADTSLPSEDDLRDAIRRLILRVTCNTGGVLQPGSREWWGASAVVQIASVAILGREYLPQIRLKADEPPTLRWPVDTGHPPFSELRRRRAVAATPMRCGERGCGGVVTVEHRGEPDSPLPDARTVRCLRHQPRHLRVVPA
jgi:hypothetical protein